MLTLRPYQQAAITAIYGYFEKTSGHPLVVIPTAGGKSLVLAAFTAGVLKTWPDQRILIVTHVRELIAQNYAEMIGLWPVGPGGHLLRGAWPPRGASAHSLCRHPIRAHARIRNRSYRSCAHR